MTSANLPPSRCILLVEPEPDLREVITLGLTTLTPWTIIPAKSGREGLDLARTHHPDVVLLDLNIHDVMTFARLKADPQTHALPIIALVPRLLAADRVQLAEQGFAGAIALPLDTSVLHVAIASILNWPELDR